MVRVKREGGKGGGAEFREDKTNLMIWNWSILLTLGADLRSYLGARASFRVLGRLNVVFLRTMLGFLERRPDLAAVAVLVALAAAPP